MEKHGWTSSRLIFAQIPTEGRFRCCSCLARDEEIVDHGILQHALNIAFRFVIGDALNPSQHVHPRQVRSAILRSEEHTSELQSLLRNSSAVLCLKQKQHSVRKK